MRNILLSNWKLQCCKPGGNEVFKECPPSESYDHLDEIAAQRVLCSAMLHKLTGQSTGK